MLLADDAHAIVHSDPDAILDRRATPTRQRLHATHDGAISAVLDPMLRDALADLENELPKTVTPQIQPADERFALETIARQRNPENPDSAARKIAAGLAWERALTALAHHLAGEHEHLRVIAERWKPKEARIDLDLILADEQKGIVWVIDAKNATPTNDQLHKMQAQLRLLDREPALTGGRPITGLIVHRKRQLDPPIQPSEHHNILRATAQRLPDLLLARRLPGERPKRTPAKQM